MAGSVRNKAEPNSTRFEAEAKAEISKNWDRRFFLRKSWMAQRGFGFEKSSSQLKNC